MQYKFVIVVLILSLFGVPATFAQGACSSSGTLEEFETTFLNDTGIDLVIHWVDPDCVEAEGTPLADGEDFQFITYDGHEFVFRDAKGNVRLSYTVTAEDADQVVSLKLAIETYEAEEWIDITCSSGGTQEEVQATLLNDTDAGVYMHWINYECGEGDGELIAVGEEFPFTTYDGHEFIFRDADGEERAPYVISSNIAEIVVPISEIIAESADVIETCSSSGTGAELQTAFLNDTDADVTIHWLDFGCAENEGIVIHAGEDHPLTAFDGHEFAFRDLDGELFGYYTVTKADADEIILISGLASEQQSDDVELLDSIVTLTGNLTTAEDTYNFEAEAGVEYVIRLTSEEFDTYLHLYDPDGVEVAYNDDGAGDLNSLIVYAALEDGIYTVGIDSFNDAAIGSYTLSIAHPTTVISSFLATKGPTATAIDVEKGVTYFIFVSSDEFDTVLTVLDENGDEVASNDDRGDGTTNSFVWFTAATTGSYTVQVASYSGDAAGQFAILIGAFELAE